MSENNEYDTQDVDLLGGGGFFDGEDVAEVSDDPFGLPDGTYAFKIVKAYIKKTAAGDKVGLNVQLSCIDSAYRGITVWSQWRRVPMKADPDFNSRLASDDADVKSTARAEFERLQGFLKRDLLAYGLGANELAAPPKVLLDNLLARKVKARIANETNSDGKSNKAVKALYPYDEVSDEDGGPSADDFNDEPDF